jgi:ATP-binding cassette subfamily F protein uup
VNWRSRAATSHSPFDFGILLQYQHSAVTVPLLTLDQVSLAFGHLPLLEGAELRVEPGERIALIGRNGSGKSSLLKIVAGDMPPDGGTIWRSPGLRLARLEQEVPGEADRTVFDEVASGLGALGAVVAGYHHAAMHVADGTARDPEAALNRLGVLQQQLEEQDGWRLEQKVETVVSRLGLPADRPMRELSGGWRRRALLGKALVSEPELLLLDEPTNHLDIDAIRWLEEHLRTYAGAILFVTHDRAFLSNLATRIVELDRGRLTSWPGTYQAYLQKKSDALETEARELERLDKKLEKEEAWLRQGVKARRTRNEGRVKDLMELRAQRAAYRAQSGNVRLAIDAAETTGKVVFEAEAVSKSLGGAPIIRDYSQRILRGDRVGLIGPNGSGKTTLLRLLVGEMEPDAGEVKRGTRLQVAYFDQQREQLDPEQSVAATVNDGNDTVIVNGQPRHIIGYLADFLFPRERALSPVKTLSGGERNRLLLARLFARPANVLVLDEPTNDLDIETLELLEELISDFDGTVLLVSHDRVFLDNIVTSTLAFEGAGRVVEYVGGWQDYLRQAASAAQPARREGPVHRTAQGAVPLESQSGPGPVAVTPAARKLSYKEKKEMETLPAHIEALEAEQARLQQESASADFYKSGADHIRAVLGRIDAIGPELETALARWVELDERNR